MKIIVADDSTTIQRVIELAFKNEKVELFHVSSFVELMGETEKLSPEVLICDANLSGMGGESGLSKFKEKFPLVPFIVLKGSFDSIDETAFRMAGFTHYLKKPFDAAEIVAKVKNVYKESLDAAKQVKDPAFAGTTINFDEVAASDAPPSNSPSIPQDGNSAEASGNGSKAPSEIDENFSGEPGLPEAPSAPEIEIDFNQNESTGEDSEGSIFAAAPPPPPPPPPSGAGAKSAPPSSPFSGSIFGEKPENQDGGLNKTTEGQAEKEMSIPAPSLEGSTFGSSKPATEVAGSEQSNEPSFDLFEQNDSPPQNASSDVHASSLESDEGQQGESAFEPGRSSEPLEGHAQLVLETHKKGEKAFGAELESKRDLESRSDMSAASVADDPLLELNLDDKESSSPARSSLPPPTSENNAAYVKAPAQGAYSTSHERGGKEFNVSAESVAASLDLGELAHKVLPLLKSELHGQFQTFLQNQLGGRIESLMRNVIKEEIVRLTNERNELRE